MADETAEATGGALTEDLDAEQQPAPGTRAVETHGSDQFVESELLVEDVSIDGMCGVY